MTRPRTRPVLGTPAWRRMHRVEMAGLRERKKDSGTCRQCDLPAKVDDKTGKMFSLCDSHLQADKSRKRNARSAERKAKVNV